MDDDLVERLQAAIDQLLTCGNHIAIYRTDQWPAYELGGLTRKQQCESALRILGASRDYDMWCCWSVMMQTRDAISFQPCTVTQNEMKAFWERIAQDRLRSLWLVVHAQGGRVSIERSVQEEYLGDDLVAVRTHTDPNSRDFIIEALRRGMVIPQGDRK